MHNNDAVLSRAQAIRAFASKFAQTNNIESNGSNGAAGTVNLSDSSLVLYLPVAANNTPYVFDLSAALPGCVSLKKDTIVFPKGLQLELHAVPIKTVSGVTKNLFGHAKIAKFANPTLFTTVNPTLTGATAADTLTSLYRGQLSIRLANTVVREDMDTRELEDKKLSATSYQDDGATYGFTTIGLPAFAEKTEAFITVTPNSASDFADFCTGDATNNYFVVLRIPCISCKIVDDTKRAKMMKEYSAMYGIGGF